MLESGSETLRLEREGAVAIVTLDRPERLNAITWESSAELAGLLGALALDGDVRVVVLTGAGRAFCAGGDITAQAERATLGVPEKVARAQPMLDAVRAVWDFPKPLIAAVNGAAAGAGAGLALLSDIRCAAEGAKIGFPFVNVALGPDFGVSYTLPRLVGHGVAAELLYTARYVEAQEAKAIGLVDHVFPAEQLLPSTLALANEIASRPAFGVRLAKLALRRASDVPFAVVVRDEMLGQHLAQTTDEHREAAAAFLRRG